MRGPQSVMPNCDVNSVRPTETTCKFGLLIVSKGQMKSLYVPTVCMIASVIRIGQESGTAIFE